MEHEEAKKLAWRLYVSRVRAVLKRQMAAVQAGHEPPAVVMTAPMPSEVAMIHEVLEASYELGRQKATT